MNAGFNQNPLHVASMAQRMAENSHGANGVVFQNVAMVSMGVMALASVVQVLTPLLHELNRKYDHGKECGHHR